MRQYTDITHFQSLLRLLCKFRTSLHPYKHVRQVHMASYNLLPQLPTLPSNGWPQPSHQSLVEHHVPEPLVVQVFKGREDEEGFLLVALGLLDGALWVGDAHGGLGAHVFLKTSHWGLVQPTTQRLSFYFYFT